MAFERSSEGIVARLSPAERALILQLTGDMRELLSSADDPSFTRLLPDAYPTDCEASLEFSRLTRGDLVERKIEDQGVVARVLGGGASASDSDSATTERTVLSPPDALALARALGDMRLVLADRLGIHEDGDDGFGDPENEVRANVYAWLGYLQGTLIDAIDE